MLFRMRRSMVILAVVAMASGIACGKKKDKDKNEAGRSVTVKAQSLALATPFAKQLAAKTLFAGPKSPDYANGEYDGMGVHTSEAVVESFKLKFMSVSISNATTIGGTFNFPDEEIEIAAGVNKPVEVTGTLMGGTWDRIGVRMAPYYKLTAYAYMDTDNDGTVDTTVFTTADQVKKEAGRLTKDEMFAKGYAEYRYGFLYTYCSDSVTNSTEGECGLISVLPQPFETEAAAEEAEAAGEQSITVNLLVDSTKVVTAWDGKAGTYQVNGTEPTADILGDPTKDPMNRGYPQSGDCSDNNNEWGLNTCDFFPMDKPAFGVQYIPAFAFLNATNLTSQVYLVSKDDGSWNHYNTGAVQIVFKGDEPQFGLVFNSLSNAYDQSVKPHRVTSFAGPILGAVARLFEKQEDGSFKFYMDGGSADANGNEDGGLYYNNDKNMAGFIASEFKPMANVGNTNTMKVSDGPRCKYEYDYCVGDQTYYVKRIR